MPTKTHLNKSKVTVTLDPDLIKQLDHIVERQNAQSRSQLIEEALRAWLQDFAQAQLIRETEAYYSALTPTERDEDQAWSRFSSKSAKSFWDD